MVLAVACLHYLNLIKISLSDYSRGFRGRPQMQVENCQTSATVAPPWNLAIVTPVFNDWPSLFQLINELDHLDLPSNISVSLFAIDDGSNEASFQYQSNEVHRICDIEVITLVCNMGHQRAIAVGLVEVYSRKKFDAVLVMDSDGEDCPSDVPRLVEKAMQCPGCIICAQRRRRPGLLAFRIWYECYKLVFRILTGEYINFGNFCLIPGKRLEALVTNPSIWNNLAGALMRARLPLGSLQADRGQRYAGRSKMNFVSLVMHGLSAMAVYSDTIMVRMLLAALGLSVLTTCGLFIVIFIKLITNLAIPGWATSSVGILLVILLQALMFFTISAFNMMSARSIKAVIPLLDAPSFILSRRAVLAADLNQAAE